MSNQSKHSLLSSAGSSILKSDPGVSGFLQPQINRYQKDYTYRYRKASSDEMSFSISDASSSKGSIQLHAAQPIYLPRLDEEVLDLEYRKPPDFAYNSRVEIYKNFPPDSVESVLKVDPVVCNGVLISNHYILTYENSFRVPDSALIYKTPLCRLTIDPDNLFITSQYYEFSLIYIQEEQNGLDLGTTFKLNIRDTVKMIVSESWVELRVIVIKPKYFCFTSGKKESIYPGAPVFSKTWELMGIYTRSILDMNYANRLEPIIYHLLNTRGDVHSMYIEPLIKEYLFYNKPKERELAFYLSVPGSQRLERFTKHKQEVVVSRNVDFTWEFYSDDLILVQDNTIYVIGGDSTNQVLAIDADHYYRIAKLMPMLYPRASLAGCSNSDYLFVFGGRPHYKRCEVMSTRSKIWKEIPYMYYGREQANACLSGNSIFIVGGKQELSGCSIEKYETILEKWTLLRLNLGCTVLKPGLFDYNGEFLLIVGGRTENTYVLVYESVGRPRFQLEKYGVLLPPNTLILSHMVNDNGGLYFLTNKHCIEQYPLQVAKEVAFNVVSLNYIGKFF